MGKRLSKQMGSIATKAVYSVAVASAAAGGAVTYSGFDRDSADLAIQKTVHESMPALLQHAQLTHTLPQLRDQKGEQMGAAFGLDADSWEVRSMIKSRDGDLIEILFRATHGESAHLLLNAQNKNPLVVDAWREGDQLLVVYSTPRKRY